MAILGRITVDELMILTVDTDPTVSGVAAPVGSLALIDNGTSARVWVKTGAADSGWTQQLAPVPGTAMQANTILYTDSTGQIKTDTTKFTWDQTNGRLGIGLAAPATPQSTIHIDRGTGVGGHIRFTAGSTTGQSSGDGLQVGIDDTGAAELIQYENSNINFFTNNTFRGAWGNGGQFLIGTATPIDITGLGAFPTLQFVGTSAVQMVGIQYSADSIGPVFNQLKSRGATVGAQGLLQLDDEFGRFQFRGSDGVNFQAGASIRALVDGTPAAGSMPGRLILMTTPSGATVPVERMRISQNGLVRIVDALQSYRRIEDFQLATTANTTTTLTSANAGVIGYSGSTAGQIVRLPDATTLTVGAVYEIRNTASVTIAIQDNAGGALSTVPAVSGAVVAILVANANAAGTWFTQFRFEPYYNTAISTTNMALASTTDVLVTGMTITPPAGIYKVDFNSSINMSTANATYGCAVYVGGTIVSETDRAMQVGQISFGTFTPGTLAITTGGIVTVNGSQAIEIRARRSAGTTTIQKRTMVITRVG